MPLTPLNNDFLQCPICFNPFSLDRKPITLACSHTCCCSCLTSLQNCPFDQTLINAQLPENEAILSLISHAHLQSPKSEEASLLANGQPLSSGLCHKLLNTFELTDDELIHYCKSVDCIKQLAQLLRPQNSGCALSRSMQRKLVTFLHCQLVEPEGRLRAVKNARSIGERTLSELLLKHQDPYTLSANLWAAVRSRGCQFLGPAMQEEILKLVLLALEEGSQLSRKVLVMFVVQRLSPHFPHQASKTAIGHVIQLLYRASCFRLTKRDGDSSLMQLKEEYCSYEALRREHDTQIVSIALESGLKILPDQWSSLLYGDMQHKSHMQSIIDKLQSPQSFHQSIQELVIALQRTQDPAGLIQLREHFERLARIESAQVNSNSNTETSSTSPANIETVLNGASNETNEVNNCTTSTANDTTEADGNLSPSVSTTPTTPNYPTFQELAEILDSCRLVTFRLIDFLRQHGGQTPATNGNNTNGINGAGPHRYNGRGSSGGLSTGSGGRYRGGPRGNAPKQSSFATAPAQVNGVSTKAYGGPISPEKNALQLTNGYKSNSQPTLPLALTTNSNVGLVGGSRVVRDQKHKSCAQVQPCTQSPPPPPPPTHVINVKPAHVAKSTSPKHQQQLLNGYKGGHGNNYTNGTINQTNGQARRAELNNYPFKMNQINAALNEHANALNTKNRSTLPLQTTQYLKQQQQLLKQLSPLGQAQTLSQANVHLTNGGSTPVGVPQVKNMQNGLSINQATTKNFLSLLSGSATVSQKSCSSAAQTATIGSFEDDQFIPFADQPFVSKFGPISRSMQLLDTQTITGSTARSTSASGLGHSNEQLRDIWSSGFGTLGNSMSSEDATTHLTNVMLGRQGMPSLTLIEPLQQLSLNSSIFADQQFL